MKNFSRNETRELSLDEFLNILSSDNCTKLCPPYRFPTDELRDEYLDTIEDYSEEDIRMVLRRLIIHSCSFGLDEIDAFIWFSKEHPFEDFRVSEIKTERHRRSYSTFILGKGEVWEGLTWVLDLLPDHPQNAIDTIKNYLMANPIPDYTIDGLCDCIAIINARYIYYKHPLDILLDLNPLDFEYLIATLYEKIGYKVTLTKRSYDEGIDIFASNLKLSRKEKLIIQCKKYENTVGVSCIRQLLGSLTDKKATKGVLVTTSKYSKPARKFENENPSIELIDIQDLHILLNTHLGADWYSYIEFWIKKIKSKLPVSKKKSI